MTLRTALRDPLIRRLSTAQALSVIGDGCNSVALAFAVVMLTDSTTLLSAALAARVVGLTVSLLFGGVMADRFDRGSILIWSDLIRFVAQAVLAAGLLSGHVGVPVIIGLQLVHGLASGCFLPTYGGFIARLVATEQLQRTNAAITTAAGIANVAGPALAGALTATVGPAWALGIDALTFLGSAMLIASCQSRMPRFERAGEKRSGESVLHELRSGGREVLSRPWLTAGVGYFVVSQLCITGPLFVLGPVLAEQHLGGAAAWGILLTGFAGGGVLGSLVAARFEPRRPMLTMLCCAVLIAPLLLAFSLRSPFAVLVTAEVIAGAATMFTDILWQSTMQAHVPDAVLSRVLSWDLLGYTLSRPVSMGLVGFVAQTAGMVATFAAAALALITTAAITASLRPSRMLGRQPLPSADSKEGLA
ncbi:MFS transporter [Actinoplanes sichuanensis]|uniref:MFS transporter n=1 Tax=Actinoplanes sichuanensis TaxID=512349 RepID=A0ABW4AV27_9ACTN|nr:MFS transporter [Actinoplanes sichuanensis]BEL07223.1 MFS transporter [Actinoplanes sichuanensis]